MYPIVYRHSQIAIHIFKMHFIGLKFSPAQVKGQREMHASLLSVYA